MPDQTPDVIERPWRLAGADARLSLVRRPQGGAPDLVLDDREVVGFVVGRGQNILDRLQTAGIARRCYDDPAAPPRAPLRDPAHDRIPADPVDELAYLEARTRMFVEDLVAPHSSFGVRTPIPFSVPSVSAVVGPMTAALVAIREARTAVGYGGPPAETNS